MNPITYKMMLDKLERELAEIDHDLNRGDVRKTALERRRSEVLFGIEGIKELLKGAD